MSASSAASSVARKACSEVRQELLLRRADFESGIVGAAIGMAAYGCARVEVQFDYVYPAYDQIVSKR